MAEESEDAQKQESSGAPDPLAAQLALAASGLAPEEAREYLKRQSTVAEKQSRLLDLQIENMRDVDKYELSHLRWRRFNDQMRGALQIMLVLVGALIVLGIGALVWQAHEARGLVAEPFRTPADFAARGLDGTVLAQQLLDRLDALIDRSNAYNLR
ncbi:MAG: hypothetical protein JSR81_16035, partial [Proteobacteria bacterium]|nr:hypothetical protein [Pseudomonadota bacterium]